MSEENKTLDVQTQAPGTSESQPEDSGAALFMAKINDLQTQLQQKNAKINKLEADYSHMVNNVLNGGTYETETPTTVDVEAERKKLFDLDNQVHSNREICESILKLREGIMRKDGTDIFMPNLNNPDITQNDIIAARETAERVAESLKYCLDNCEGDDKAFNAILTPMIKDSPRKPQNVLRR